MRFLGTIFFIIFLFWSHVNANQFALKGTAAEDTLDGGSLLPLLLETHTENYNGPSSGYTLKLKDFLNSLKAKQARFKSEELFLEFLFYKVHRKYLRSYEAFSTFDRLLANGRYDCLTGTAFYAYLLEELGLEYKIFETKYHIYLVVHTNDKKILFESTDPLNGFVNKPKEIADRIKVLEADNLNGKSNGQYYEFKADIFNTIDLLSLVGLLYYNQAVNAYNQQDFSRAITQLEKAAKLYPSKRIQELTSVILEAIRWDRSEKRSSEVSKLNRLRQAIASR